MDDNRAANPSFYPAIPALYPVIPVKAGIQKAANIVIPAIYPVIPAKAGIQKAANIAGYANERGAPAR